MIARAVALALLVTALTACGHRRTENPANAEGVLDCEAATRASGDECELMACQECVDFCGLDCALVEAEPTQFTCPGIGAYTIHDTCPEEAEQDSDPPADEAATPDEAGDDEGADEAGDDEGADEAGDDEGAEAAGGRGGRGGGGDPP